MQQWQHQFSVMGGPAQLLLHSDDRALFELAAEKAEALARHYEQKYSRYRDDSVLMQINRSDGTKISVDDETAAILHFADQAYQISEGLFDVTSGVLRRIWNFSTAQMPTAKQVTDILPLVSWSKVHWQAPYLTLPIGMELDLGGLVKEYAVDAIADALRALNVRHGLISLAGDIAVIGPPSDKAAWPVAISDPDQPTRAKAQLDLFDGALASSGDYERFFIHNGQRYCHILNPFTGMPAQGVAGVSVQAPRCIVAGTLSTIAMLKGPVAGREFLQSTGMPYVLFPR